jgi:hypothetical protein
MGVAQLRAGEEKEGQLQQVDIQGEVLIVWRRETEDVCEI